VGVVHFATLGQSVGAVTVGINYCVQNYKRWKKNKPEILESVVIITTAEMRREQEIKLVDNQYGKTFGNEKTLNQSPYELCREYIEKDHSQIIGVNRGKIEPCLVDIRDFYHSVKEVLGKLYDYRNKEIWLNITGGMNTLTIQALFAAYLSGVVAKVYYTYVSQNYSRYIRPISEEENQDFMFIELPSIKATLDETVLCFLTTIKDSKSEVKIEEVISRLKNSLCNTPDNIQDFLRKVTGQGLVDINDGRVKLTQYGENLLKLDSLIKSQR